MKLECYVFLPYEGQLRFCYDIGNGNFELSDPAFDKELKVFKLTGNRPPTCHEYIYAGKFHFGDSFVRIISGWIVPRLASTPRVELGDELLSAFPFRQGFVFSASLKE